LDLARALLDPPQKSYAEGNALPTRFDGFKRISSQQSESWAMACVSRKKAPANVICISAVRSV